MIAVDGGADITLVDAAADAVTMETLYRHRASSWAECHGGIVDHRRRHTTRIYDQSAVVAVVVAAAAAATTTTASK